MPDHTSFGHCIAAMCQIPVIYGEAEKNLQTAASAIARAHELGAQIAVLPECFDLGWAVPEEDLEKPYGATWLEPYRLICQTYGIAMVGVSCVGNVGAGAWEGWYNIGNSIAMGPSGKPLAILPFGKDAECVQIIRI